MTKSPSRRYSGRRRAIRSRSDAVRRLAVPYQVVELAVPIGGGRDSVIAMDAVDSGSVAGLAVGATLPVRLDPAAPREARLTSGTRRFVERNRYHFLPGVLGIGIIAPLAAISWRRRRLNASGRRACATATSAPATGRAALPLVWTGPLAPVIRPVRPET